MSYRLRYLHHNLELAPGQFLIGRSTECQLSLDDPLVSRKHALLTITNEGVFIEDMGSRNGVLVDGAKIEGRRQIVDGSRITIGSQDIVLLEGQREQASTLWALPAATVTSVGGDAGLNSAPPPPTEEDSSKKNDTFKLLGGVADKAIAMGRAEDAERLLQTLMQQVLESARGKRMLDPWTVEQAGRFGARLATATGKSSWFNYVVELYTYENRIMPAPVVDELHQAIRKVPSVDIPALREYVASFQENTARLGPNERFLLQRMEGLLRLASLK
ncbi:MAG: FHA domain-containing protein [Myxococcales bacterium]|nr:FHA domain-containing protein [Polyangiaceae bacterium]MDW8248701.1 FHA domain-containing protein [Myxococcales bacterium]